MRIFKHTKRILEWNSWKTKDREAEVRKTVDELAPPWVYHQEEEQENGDKKEQDRNKWKDINNDFSMAEIHRTINKIKRMSAPGRDIFYKISE